MAKRYSAERRQKHQEAGPVPVIGVDMCYPPEIAQDGGDVGDTVLILQVHPVRPDAGAFAHAAAGPTEADFPAAMDRSMAGLLMHQKGCPMCRVMMMIWSVACMRKAMRDICTKLQVDYDRVHVMASVNRLPMLLAFEEALQQIDSIPEKLIKPLAQKLAEGQADVEALAGYVQGDPEYAVDSGAH